MTDVWIDRLNALGKVGVPTLCAVALLMLLGFLGHKLVDVWATSTAVASANETKRTEAFVKMTETVIEEMHVRGEEHDQHSKDHQIIIESLKAVLERLAGEETATTHPTGPSSTDLSDGS